MKIAIVHDWLEGYAGSERVLEQMITCFPNADVFAVVDFVKPADRGFLQDRPVKTSFVQRLPFARRRFRLYLPLMPFAVEQFDLTGYDLVLSSSHAVAKGVITGPDQVHVSYVHSPMRYAWDLQAQYLRESGLNRGLKSIYARWMLHRLRLWDLRTANGVDVFIANSRSIALRINKVYRRNAGLVHPPVDIDSFAMGTARRGSHYVIAARFVPYKRVELVVAAFVGMPVCKLTVIGDGPNADRVAAAAAGAANIQVLGSLPRAELIRALQTARAFVFAAEEDFGITMVEAQACGTPVIAYGRGGARDIVIDGKTGVLFAEQTVESIADAVRRFEALGDDITAASCRTNAESFSHASFHAQFREAVDEAMAAHEGAGRLPSRAYA
jgi:glycosyltransferase involved in cell wall biosynthesis